jgi:hypothetical protein
MPPVWDFSPLGKNHRPCRGEIALGRFFALGRELQTPPGWNCTFEDFSPEPRRGGIALGSFFRPCARIAEPARVELHLEDFSPLDEIRRPRRGGIALGVFFALARESQTPPGWNCARSIFRPCGDDKPHPGGIGLGRPSDLGGRITNPTRMELHLGRSFALGRVTNPAGVELHLEGLSPLRGNRKPRRGGIALGRCFALGRESQTPPGWNCTLEDLSPKPRRCGIFRPWPRITNPTGVDLHLEDFSPLGENYKPHPDGIALSRIFRPNPAGVELHLEDFSPLGVNRRPRRGGIAFGRFFALGRESQTPPWWNCTWKILCPCARVTNPDGVELHSEYFSPLHLGGIGRGRPFALGARITNPTRMELHLGRSFTLGRVTNPAGVELHLEGHSPLRENRKPRRGGIALGRCFALGRESQTPPRWNCTLEDLSLKRRRCGIFRPWARITDPAGVELHLEGFSPLGENYKPHPDGIALSRIFRPNPAGVELHLEDFSPLGENRRPRRGGIALGVFFALARESQTPPGWNCARSIFRPCA